jgi:hypothetical protein
MHEGHTGRGNIAAKKTDPSRAASATIAPEVRVVTKILRDAIAYRRDYHAREAWANARQEAIPVGCPSGCMVEYDLFVSEQASGEDALKWVEAVLDRMERQHPNHESVIAF